MILKRWNNFTLSFLPVMNYEKEIIQLVPTAIIAIKKRNERTSEGHRMLDFREVSFLRADLLLSHLSFLKCSKTADEVLKGL